MNINPNIFEEDYFPVFAGHPLLPVSRSSVNRMIHKGYRSVNGKIIKLEVAKIGRLIFTSNQAVIRFVKRLNGFED